MRKGKTYYFINVFSILVTAVCFVYKFGLIYENAPSQMIFFRLAVLTAVVIIVHAMKAFRLYFAMYGTGITAKRYLGLYCKVTPVSIVLPFKLGEFFRMYCYGCEIGNYLRGTVIVLMDRFIDTTALITMILAVLALTKDSVTLLVYVFFLFLFVAVIFYFLFPGLYLFWKKYFLRSRASESKMRMLTVLESIHSIYREIANVLKGRGLILYIISLISWCAEIGSLAVIGNPQNKQSTGTFMMGYLAAAISADESEALDWFVLISVAVLLVLYIVLKTGEAVHKKKEVLDIEIFNDL